MSSSFRGRRSDPGRQLREDTLAELNNRGDSKRCTGLGRLVRMVLLAGLSLPLTGVAAGPVSLLFGEGVVDNAQLDQVLADGCERTFWIKPYGLPGSRATGNESFNTERLRVDFARRPRSVSQRDILLVYRIGDGQLIYIAECESELHEATADEISANPNRGRWPWYIWARNLTPEFGCEWSTHDLNPFRLAEAYNDLHPETPENLNGLMFGSDKLRVSRSFAEFVINRITSLPQ